MSTSWCPFVSGWGEINALDVLAIVISGGGDAMNVYAGLYLVEDTKEVEKIREDLRAYCRMDTLGMVRILDKLREVSRNTP